MDRGVLRQLQVDQQLGTVRRREELARHLTQRHDGDDEDCERQGDGEPARAHRQRQKTPVDGDRAARLVARTGLGRAQERHADQGGEHHCNEPGGDQCDADNREDRKGVFARRALSEADGHETGDGDQGADEHRLGQVCVGIGGRV